MEFSIFSQLFGLVDELVSGFAAEVSGRMIDSVAPAVTAAVSLWIVGFGIMVTYGGVSMPIQEFFGRMFKMAVIAAIALNSGNYINWVAETIRTTPDTLTAAVLAVDPGTASAAELIDQAARKGFDKAAEAFDLAGVFSSEGIAYALIGILLIISTTFTVAIGGTIFLLTKIMLALLAGIGPLFIAAAMFRPTQQLFASWVSAVLNYTVLVLLFSSVFTFVINIYANYMEDLQFGDQNVGYIIGGACCLATAVVVVLMHLPAFSAQLTNGVSMSLGGGSALPSLSRAPSIAWRALTGGGRQSYGGGGGGYSQRQLPAGTGNRSSGYLPPPTKATGTGAAARANAPKAAAQKAPQTAKGKNP